MWVTTRLGRKGQEAPVTTKQQRFCAHKKVPPGERGGSWYKQGDSAALPSLEPGLMPLLLQPVQKEEMAVLGVGSARLPSACVLDCLLFLLLVVSCVFLGGRHGSGGLRETTEVIWERVSFPFYRGSEQRV